MITYTATALAILARAYIEATGILETRLGLIIASHQHLITTLIGGGDCTTETAQRASDWFDIHWPPEATWPPEVWRRPVRFLTQPQPRVQLFKAPKPKPVKPPAPGPTRARRSRRNGANALPAAE